MDEFVADETDRAAGEARQAGHGHGAIAFHDALDDFEAVGDLVGRVTPCAPLGGQRTARPTFNLKFLHDLAVLDDLDAVGRLLDDGARIAADERVAPDVLAAFHGLEQERLALAADFAVGRERRLKIREDAARDGNQVSLRRELQKFFQRWCVHII